MRGWGRSGDHREAGCSNAIRGVLVLFPSAAAVSKCPWWEAANKEKEEILEGGRGKKMLGHQP